MSEHESLSELRSIARERARSGHGARIRRALLVLAIPATATLATACYGAPMQNVQPAHVETGYETICDNGIDDDGDGLTDLGDSDCATQQVK